MNISEAARRMCRAGLVLILVCAFTVYLRLWVTAALPLPNGVQLTLLVVIPGTVLWLAGWILQGFSTNATMLKR